jgi:hypothetical protein
MPGPEFFQTVMGQRFYEGTVPKLIDAVTRVADALESQKTIPMDAVVTRVAVDAVFAADCLHLLRKARDAAPDEWDALAHSAAGGESLCTLWDNLKRVGGEGA